MPTVPPTGQYSFSLLVQPHYALVRLSTAPAPAPPCLPQVLVFLPRRQPRHVKERQDRAVPGRKQEVPADALADVRQLRRRCAPLARRESSEPVLVSGLAPGWGYGAPMPPCLTPGKGCHPMVRSSDPNQIAVVKPTPPSGTPLAQRRRRHHCLLDDPDDVALQGAPARLLRPPNCLTDRFRFDV